MHSIRLEVFSRRVSGTGSCGEGNTTNDRTKRFKIVAEGMTSDGRMLMLEKIVEAGK